MGQSWNQCDPDLKKFVENIVTALANQLSDNLTGIYLHGSLAMGSYYRPKSDIDLLIAINKPLDPAAREKFALLVADLSHSRPTVGDIELSVITEQNAKHFVHPLPYEVHFSSEWKDKIRQAQVDFSKEETDPDLAAHYMVVRTHGICLIGKTISEVFQSNPWDAFVEAVLDDFEWIIEKENILESPFYAILNSCRTLQMLSEPESRLVLNKEEGAQWALTHLPTEYHPIIQKALAAYQSNKNVTPETRRTNGENWNFEALLKFRDFVAEEAGRS